MGSTDEEVIDGVVENLVGNARARTGLSDLGSGEWRDGLTCLVKTVEQTDGADPTAKDDLYSQFVAALSNRLRVIDHLGRHPEVADEPIERPLVILGLPRTGTTVASYLLDQDPARRSLLNWEAADSVPPPTTASLRNDPRCLAKKAQLDQLAAALEAAGRGMPHWEEADGPTECMFVQNQDFKALVWDAFMPTGDYSDWVLGADMTSAYAYQRSVLQLLQSNAPGTWSLKMPSHAVHIESLLATFPDARLVWAHRDPYKATASLCSILRSSKARLGGPDFDPDTVTATVIKQMAAHVDRALAARRRVGDDRFFDLHYAAVMAEPIGQMRELYEWAGDPLEPEVERSMSAWLSQHPQDRFGARRYSLADAGLTTADLEAVFEEYRATFDVESEQA